MSAQVMLNDPLMCRVQLPLSTTVYPLGFPAVVETNSASVLSCVRQSWERFSATFPEREVRLSVIVSDSTDAGELHQPVFRARGHLHSIVSDSDNFGMCDLNTGNAFAFISRCAAEDHCYLRDTYTDALLLPMIHSQYLAVVHAACVMLDGAGVLLCGGSGAGKSSLAINCALRGWTLVCDDASFLIRRRGGRAVVGNPHLMRFRPEARALFPFLADCHIDQRVNGKPTIHVPTADVPSIETAPQAEVRYMVLLQRTEGARARMVRRGEDITQHVRLPPYGDPGVIAEQEATLQALSGVPAFDLQYWDLDEAVRRLTGLVRDGVYG